MPVFFSWSTKSVATLAETDHQRLEKRAIMMYKTLHGMPPEYLRSNVPFSATTWMRIVSEQISSFFLKGALITCREVVHTVEPSCGTTHSYSQSSHGLFTAFFPFPSLSSSPEVVIYINIIPEKPTISDLIFVERISNSLEFSAYWSQKFRVSFVFAYWNNEQQLISRCQRWLRRRSSGFHEKTRQPARATSPENSGSHPQSFSRVRLYCFVFFWAHNPEEKLNKEKS